MPVAAFSGGGGCYPHMIATINFPQGQKDSLFTADCTAGDHGVQWNDYDHTGNWYAISATGIDGVFIEPMGLGVAVIT